MRTIILKTLGSLAILAGTTQAQAPVVPAVPAAPAAASPAGVLTGSSTADCTTCTGGASAEGLYPTRDQLLATRYWFKADYLYWYTNNQVTPPLIQAVPATQVNVGALLPGASSQFQVFPGRNGLGTGGSSGYRFTAGGYFNECWAFEASGFMLNTASDSATVVGDGSPTSPGISRGYISTGDNIDHLLYFNLPGEYAGGVTASVSNRVYGAEANLKCDWYRVLADKNELIMGFRYMNVKDSLSVTGFILPDVTGSLVISDFFRTTNQFYGPQIGIHSAIAGFTRLQLEQTAKVGIGGVHQTAQASGFYTARNAAGNITAAFDTGLYANTTNRGTFSRDKFACLLEYGLDLSVHLTSHAQLRLGYNITYLSSAVRVGPTIDPQINDSRLPYRLVPPPVVNDSQHSFFDFNRATTDFWAHGVNIGFSITY